VKVNNVVKKPGPVFNQMAKHAYAVGAQYFYRLNDDTELTAPWVTEFVDQLQKFRPPYGVVGPQHTGGVEHILTHDFVHRTHMEIFNQMYYPAELVDWWMDDWITHVYGPIRTQKVSSATATHHIGHQGTRYDVNMENSSLLRPALVSGKRTIAKYMQTHELPGFEKLLEDADKLEGWRNEFNQKYGDSDAKACQALADEFKVEPGVSWGSLNDANQLIWKEVECDKQLAMP